MLWPLPSFDVQRRSAPPLVRARERCGRIVRVTTQRTGTPMTASAQIAAKVTLLPCADIVHAIID